MAEGTTNNEPLTPSADEARRIKDSLAAINGKTALEIATERAHLLERNQQLEAEIAVLRELSNKDEFTGLLNQRGIYQEWDLVKAVLERKNGNNMYTIVILDLVGLHRVNEEEGRSKGDEYVLQVARALEKNAKRGSDIAGRYGGDEFVLVAPNISADGGLALAVNVQRELPLNRGVNVVIGNFNLKNDDLREALPRAMEFLNEAKQKAEKDEYGRSRQMGVVIQDKGDE